MSACVRVLCLKRTRSGPCRLCGVGVGLREAGRPTAQPPLRFGLGQFSATVALKATDLQCCKGTAKGGPRQLGVGFQWVVVREIEGERANGWVCRVAKMGEQRETV